MNRPRDYVLIDQGKVYDVRCMGGGPYVWAMETVERPAQVDPKKRWLLRTMVAALLLLAILALAVSWGVA